jgi:hypothetical protein
MASGDSVLTLTQVTAYPLEISLVLPGPHVAAFEQAGCRKLSLIPCSNDLDQVGLLSQAIHR